ncbi:MAG: TDT family transporter [Actinocrinis sp.]
MTTEVKWGTRQWRDHRGSGAAGGGYGPAGTGYGHARRGWLRELEHPGQAFSNLTPNWFASVMGTAIVAVAGVGLPVGVASTTGWRGVAVGVWALAALLLVILLAATAVHWARYRETARGHALDPVVSHFYGAPPMAMLAVGAATVLVGRDVIGLRAAVDADWVLWAAGTITGLLSATAVPYLMFTRHEVREGSAFGGWLMSVVPPMVSASTGALLIPYTAAGQARLTLLVGCYAMFGMSLIASVVIITLIWQRLAVHKVGAPRMVPALWIVLGPLGQSVTAANLLGGVAHLALPGSYGVALRDFGLVYGVPVWGFAVLWAMLALAVTVRTASGRGMAGAASTVGERLPFSLTWWSFTFPVGTCVTGTSALAADTGADALRVAALIWFAGLVGAWLVVAVRTGRGVASGALLKPPPAMPAVIPTAVSMAAAAAAAERSAVNRADGPEVVMAGQRGSKRSLP